VNGKFINGQARAVEATLVINGQDEWDRFMRFMDRYAETNGLGLERND
ncbi:MAG: photosystem II reaction center protein Psb28, partial [Cyanobacteria bacterium J06641_5]